MPEPTTDIKGKQLPKWGYIAIIGGAVVLFLYYRKKKSEEGPANPYTAQSFIPVTGENVAGAGASGIAPSTTIPAPEEGKTLDALLKSEEQYNNAILAYLQTAQRTENPKTTTAELKELIELSKQLAPTGGGPSHEGQIGSGAGGGGSPSGGTPKTPVATPPAVNSCPSSFPNYNPANGRPSIHSCYRISREKAKRKGYVIHGYQDGHEVESR